MTNRANLKQLLILILCFILLHVLSGCNAITHWKRTDPVIEIKLNDVDDKALALTAERRLVLARKESTTESTKDINYKVCAEPSPDVVEALADIFRFEFENKAVKQGVESILMTNPSSIFTRSQGVQFYRDSIFALCQAAMNGWVGTDPIRTTTPTAAEQEEKGDTSNQPNYYGSLLKSYNKSLESYNKSLESHSLVGNNSSEVNKKLPEPPFLSEFELALRLTRRDAKEIILAEIAGQKSGKQATQIWAAAYKAAAEQFGGERKRYEELYKLFTAIMSSLNIEYEPTPTPN